MIKKGNRIENPVTGETMTFLQTAEDTNGELLQILLQVKPGGFVAAPHTHPQQDEHFLVKSGTLRLRVGKDEKLLTSGQEGVVPAGIPHVWRNGGEDELEALVEFHPALRTQDFFSTFFALNRAGLTNKKGLPNMLQIAATLQRYRKELYIAGPPIILQKALFTILAPIARLFGYKADYPDCPQAVRSQLGRLESPHYSGC